MVSAPSRPTETRYGVWASGGGAVPWPPLHMPGDAAADDIVRSFRGYWESFAPQEFGRVGGTKAASGF